MDPTIPASPDTNDLRLALIRELSESLAQSQTALLASDLPKFESQTARQAEICCKLGSLLASLDSAIASQQSAVLVRELARAQSDLQQQVRVYGALLRRARRTVGIFCRVLACSGATYTVPATGS